MLPAAPQNLLAGVESSVAVYLISSQRAKRSAFWPASSGSSMLSGDIGSGQNENHPRSQYENTIRAWRLKEFFLLTKPRNAFGSITQERTSPQDEVVP